VRVVEAWDGPQAVGEDPEIREAHERYVKERLGIVRVDRFYSSEPYGAHMSRALGAEDRRVDPSRAAVPVSGAAIRADPFAHRRFLHPSVYRDHLTTAVLLGAPCTGKSTLAARLARELGTTWVPEYGREYWERHQIGRRLGPEQLVEIAVGHREREDSLVGEARGCLFVDTNALTTVVFARYYHGEVHPRLAAMAEACVGRYDLLFLCGDEFPYQATWDRSGPGSRSLMQRMVQEDLAARRLAAVPLAGTVDERARAVREVLGRYRKWGEGSTA
jgi:NadR type nicotinamide-nucleotide adenylyltransferase